MTRPAELHAWIDESMHAASAAAPDGMYLLAAAVADPAACEPVREALRDLRPGRAPRLHWKDADARSRHTIADAVAQMATAHTVVIGAPLNPHRQERARRLCMERLLYELAAIGVSKAWVESRTDSLNRRDLRMIDALRSRRTIPPTLSLEFALPSKEPMVWLPDIIAGAVGLQRRALDTYPYERLRHRITVHDIRI